MRPKGIRKYTIPTYYDEDVGSFLDYGQYGNCLYQANIPLDKGAVQDDVITFDAAYHTYELNKDYLLIS